MNQKTDLVFEKDAAGEWRWRAEKLTQTREDNPVKVDRRVTGRSSEGYVAKRDCWHGARMTLAQISALISETLYEPEATERTFIHADDVGRLFYTVPGRNGEPLAVQGNVGGYDVITPEAQAHVDILLTGLALLNWHLSDFFERAREAQEE